jgi:hypothetical protein
MLGRSIEKRYAHRGYFGRPGRTAASQPVKLRVETRSTAGCPSAASRRITLPASKGSRCLGHQDSGASP